MEDFKYNKKINKIKALLGLDIKLEQIALDNGVVFEAESFEPGQPVFVLAEGERMPVPVGEFELPDGRVLVVMEEGVISEMRSMDAEEAPEEQEMEAEPETPAKKVVESTTKETHFNEEKIGETGYPIVAHPTERITEIEERLAQIEAKLSESIESKEVKSETVEVEASEEKTDDIQEVELKEVKPKPEKNTKVKFTNNFKRPSTHHEKVLKQLFS